jgi:hypothetical protein
MLFSRWQRFSWRISQKTDFVATSDRHVDINSNYAASPAIFVFQAFCARILSVEKAFIQTEGDLPPVLVPLVKLEFGVYYISQM